MGHDPRQGRILSWLPPYHDMGLMGTIILSMYHGWPLVLMSPMHFVQEPRRWLKAITDYRVTITVGTELLARPVRGCDDRQAKPADLDLSTVKELYCGAEPISADTLRTVRADRGAPLGFDGECADSVLRDGGGDAVRRGEAARIAVPHRHAAPEPVGTARVVVSCGEVDTEHTVRIVDPTTRHGVGRRRVGEIWVSGRSVAAGYYNRA